MRLLERESALTALGQALDAARAGTGSVALVTGEPGIGKTALVRCFVRRHTGQARVLSGWCDDLASPRPLSALRDLSRHVSPQLALALSRPTPPHLLHSLLLRELRLGTQPAILALEDVHWADQATLDAVTVVGRRIGDVPAVLVITYRPGELAPSHPLLATVEAVKHATSTHLELAPLSRHAVQHLAGASASPVYEATGGNPLLVTEMLAEDGQMSSSLRTLVRGRLARLPVASQRLLEVASVLPSRAPTAVLDRVLPGWTHSAEPAERVELISSDADHVWFRHELTRQAVLASLPASRRRRLHGQVLQALEQLNADPADLVHHAEHAGAHHVVGMYARQAAARARDAQAHRETVAHLHRALRFADDIEVQERARLWEQLATDAYFIGATDEALRAAGHAMTAYREAGCPTPAAGCLTSRALLQWVVGDGGAAHRDAREAIRLLPRDAPEAARAHAWQRLAELAMLAGRTRESDRWCRRALQLSPGDDEVSARALLTLGAVRLQLDPDDSTALEGALQVCVEAGLHEHTALIRIAHAFVNLQWVRPEEASRYVEWGRAHTSAHELDTLGRYLDGLGAWLHLRAGRADTASTMARRVLSARDGERTTVADLQARTVLAEAELRYGTEDVDHDLTELAAAADRTRELKRIQPVLELQVEAALLAGREPPVSRFSQIRRIVGTEPLRHGGTGSRFAAWAAVCGLEEPHVGREPVAHAAMRAGDWRAAADAFRAVSWWYDRALMLALEGSEPALKEALQIARTQAAPRLAARIADQLRERSLPVPRGPVSSTQDNPAHLTDRQLEVLRLVRAGLRNAEIAARLQISPRTVEHHVSDAYAKLGVRSRAGAIVRCVDLGLPE